ncbi:unnamed protein product [Didymodactylos carnosus]|uniref:Thioredoxin-like fold domain-containing protein n=1 Tax=Didymodactylos carnosus TaxID=1234261 RepID=A0A813SIF3_9BILA|nr:unnamed protein product [Didymodactylos carnosus]CAF0984540.1 unnamed protein product [Didymodactylos carnosus]CAF3582256.1 unnamed protein product [Didymodactylos carnosus]CAF3754895.1 unnamed protein product [Didymodactylos carnosus]
MSSFTTETLRDLTYDLLSLIAKNPEKFDEYTEDYIKKLQSREDIDELRKYTREIFEKLLVLHHVQANPLQLKDLFHENIIAITFWTYSCIHCLQVLPRLNMAYKRFSTAGIAMIGVHSPKYEHEKMKLNVRHAVDRLLIEYPVLNDNALATWKGIDIQCWPTVLILSPDAVPLLILEGENHVQHLETFLQPLLTHYKSSVRATNKISIEDLNTQATVPVPKTTLRYPTYICVTSGGELIISFSGSNQLLACDMTGKVDTIIGTGQAGLADGELSECEFDSPHGLAEYNNVIYVADTNNHAIRAFDLNSRRVLTLIGTGRQGSDKIGGMKRSQQPIASPYDVCLAESPFDNKHVLLIAMAGSHQIWVYAFEETQWWNNIVLSKNSCSAIIGSGVEQNKNDSQPMVACLAKPTGICRGVMDGKQVLFISDIGGELDPTNLSAFGDLDGSAMSAKLQHPTGIAFHYETNHLYLCDTYNNKLKCVDVPQRQCKTYFLQDTDTRKQRGETNSAKFNEPTGLVIFEHFMWVADTNNSCVKRIDLQHGNVVRVRFDLSETSEERTFSSKQAYLTLVLPENITLREKDSGQPAGTWNIEDEDGFKVCDGELTRNASDTFLLDYIPRDKNVAQLKYELMVCEGEKCTMVSGDVKPINQTDSSVEFEIRIDSLA